MNMRYVFQIVNHENGTRTSAMDVSIEEFKECLALAEENSFEDPKRMKDFVLLLAAYGNTEGGEHQESFAFMQTPLATVEQLVERYIKENANNG